MKKNHIVYFLALSLLVTGLNARAADQAKEVAAKQEVIAEAADAEKPEEKKAIDPFIGRGGVDQPHPTGAGELTYAMKIGRAKGVGSRSTSAEFEVTYGIDLYGKAVELHCVTPFTKEKGIDEDGNSYRNSGFESVTCGAKALVYDNDKTGVAASVGLDIQSSNTIGRGMPGRDPNYHMIVPFNVMKSLSDGNAAVVGTVIMDHTMGGPTNYNYGVGYGRRLNDTTSLSGDVLRANTGETTSSLVLAHQQIDSNKLFWVRVWRTRGGDPMSAGKGVEIGIEITREKSTSAMPAFAGMKKSPEAAISQALNPRK